MLPHRETPRSPTESSSAVQWHSRKARPCNSRLNSASTTLLHAVLGEQRGAIAEAGAAGDLLRALPRRRPVTPTDRPTVANSVLMPKPGAGLVADSVRPLPKPAGPEKLARVPGDRIAAVPASVPGHERLAAVAAVQDPFAAAVLWTRNGCSQWRPRSRACGRRAAVTRGGPGGTRPPGATPWWRSSRLL